MKKKLETASAKRTVYNKRQLSTTFCYGRINLRDVVGNAINVNTVFYDRILSNYLY